MGLTSAEKQRALRQRRADQGLTEVRGIYAPESLHQAIKQAVKKMQVQKREGPSTRNGPSAALLAYGSAS